MNIDDHDPDEPKQSLLRRMMPTEAQKDVFKHYARNFLIVNWKMLLTIGVVLFIGIPLIVYNLREEPIETVQAKSETEEKIEKFYELCSLTSLANNVSGVDQLSAAVKLGNELEASGELNPIQLDQLKMARIRALQMTCSLAKKFSLPGLDNHQDNLDTNSRNLLDDPNPMISAVAHSTLCTSLVTRYLRSPTLERVQEIQMQTAKSIPRLLKGREKLGLLTAAINGLGADKSEFRSQTQEILRGAGQQYKATGNEEDNRLGSTIHDQMTLLGRNIDQMCFMASIKNETAIEELKNFTHEATTAEFKSVALYQLVFKALETFDRIQGRDISRTISQSIDRTIGEISPSSLGSKIEKQLANYKLRSEEVLGEKIDLACLAGVDPRFDVDEKFTGKPVVILFSDPSQRSQAEARALVSFRDSNLTIYQFDYLVVSIPQILAEFKWAVIPEIVEKRRRDELAFEKTLAANLTQMFHIPQAKSDLILKQIPVAMSPYLVVLDAEHKVYATNTSAAELGKIMKKLHE